MGELPEIKKITMKSEKEVFITENDIYFGLGLFVQKNQAPSFPFCSICPVGAHTDVSPFYLV